MPDRGSLAWVAAVFGIALVGMMILAHPACAGPSIGLYWTDPATNEDSTALVDGTVSGVEWTKTFSPWAPWAMSYRAVTPGKAKTYTLSNLPNGLWKLRVVVYNSYGLCSTSTHEIWAVIMGGRIWGTWRNET